jgi:hypothetical protein
VGYRGLGRIAQPAWVPCSFCLARSTDRSTKPSSPTGRQTDGVGYDGGNALPTTTDPTFDLSWLADSHSPQDQHAVIDAMRRLLSHPDKDRSHDELREEIMGLLHVLLFQTSNCPKCNDLGATQIPIAAMHDGAVYRVDYQCPRCDHEYPVWWEES